MALEYNLAFFLYIIGVFIVLMHAYNCSSQELYIAALLLVAGWLKQADMW